jgi:glycine/sarcosine N-methyltransferase
VPGARCYLRRQTVSSTVQASLRTHSRHAALGIIRMNRSFHWQPKIVTEFDETTKSIRIRLIMNRPFYTDYAWAYDLLIQGPVASRVDFIVGQLHERGIKYGACLLDAGCGTGAYSIILADKGFVVTGLDASAELIAEAKRKAGVVAGQASFLVGDILNYTASYRMDAVLCRGVLNDLIEDGARHTAFSSFAGCLRSGGVIILDVRDWQSTVARKMDNPVFEKVVETERGRLTFRSETKMLIERQILVISEIHILESLAGSLIAPYKCTMRCWTQQELAECLGAAGFRSIQYFGDYDTSKAVGTTDRIVAVATRGE